mmetsp:Transcript_741/g.2029  ORF Transcript_741/g.2029 Transcript_741/m.2029 type:complete len:391 (+) Transcript_741:307-1479(+)
MWALGNIAGDSPRCRDLVLSYGLVPPLITQCEALVLDAQREAAAAEAAGVPPKGTGGSAGANAAATATGPGAGGSVVGSSFAHATAGPPPTMQRNATWLLSNLCRGRPPPRWELIAPALPVLVQLLHVRTDDEVLTDTCWALSYVSEPPERIAPVVEAGAVGPLVALLGHEQPTVQTPALRSIGNIVAGTAEEAAVVLRFGVLGCLGELLGSAKKELRKETAWIVSNLTAGDQAQVAAVCAAGFVPRLLEMVSSEEYDVRKEVAYALCNACCSGSAEVVRWLVELGVIALFLNLLSLPDVQLLLAVLSALEAILRAGTPPGAPLPGNGNPHARLLDEAGGCEVIEALQMHEHTLIFEKAESILETWFGGVDDDEDASTAPVVASDGFRFG